MDYSIIRCLLAVVVEKQPLILVEKQPLIVNFLLPTSDFKETSCVSLNSQNKFVWRKDNILQIAVGSLPFCELEGRSCRIVISSNSPVFVL